MVSLNVERHSWSLDQLGLAVETLGERSGLTHRVSEAPRPPDDLESDDVEAIDGWLEIIAAHLEIEVEPRDVPYPRVEGFLREATPAIVSFPTPRGRRFLALLSTRRGRTLLVTPDLATVRVSSEDLRALACGHLEEPSVEWRRQLLDELGLRGARRHRTQRALLRNHLAGEHLRGLYALRPSVDPSFWRTLRRAGVPGRMLGLGAAHAVGFALWIVSWWMIGRGTLEGRLDPGWLFAWGLLLLTMIPFEMLTSWLSGVLAVGVGGLVKERLLVGALRLDPQRVRREGAGSLYGRVMESEAIESLALGAGISGVLAFIELAVAGVVLALGPGGWVHGVLLGAWVLLTCLLSVGYYRRLRDWTRVRISMTHDMVEKIVGHRTRLAQEPRRSWHEGEDRVLETYLFFSRALDQFALRASLVADGWYVVGILGLAPALISGDASPASLAVGIGGILLAGGALSRVEEGMDDVGEAVVAWEQVRPLYRAAAAPRIAPSRLALSAPARAPTSERASPAVETHRVVFRYEQGQPAVLRGVDLRVERGERVLVEGASGCGKSTLASILAGVRVPESGMVLAEGLDWLSLGPDGWRARVTLAPQFQDNYVFADTLAFNLLIGRRWPPTAADLEDAERVCEELGLGELLDEMPGRLQQVVGEGGWQLSHGERGRLYIARALLQSPRTLVLDESFAGLDAGCLTGSLRCVLDRAGTLIVVAHP